MNLSRTKVFSQNRKISLLRYSRLTTFYYGLDILKRGRLYSRIDFLKQITEVEYNTSQNREFLTKVKLNTSIVKVTTD